MFRIALTWYQEPGVKKEKGSRVWHCSRNTTMVASLFGNVAVSLEGFVFAMELHDEIKAINVCLDGSNYRYWSCVMINFLKRKKILKYISGILIMFVLNMKHHISAESLPNHKQHLREWHILSESHHMD